MKIAVASDDKRVTQHFGHCQTFEVFDVVDGMVLSGESIKNPGHKPGFLPNFLHELGVEVIISGGMGGGAIDIFNQHGICVVVGASGESKKAAEAYGRGELESTGSICNHDHEMSH